MERKARALGMISGGLDSLLAVAVLKSLDVDIAGLHYLNGFGAGSLRQRVCERMPVEEIAADKKERLESMLSIPVRVIDVSGEFLEVLRSPRFGYGKNVNPCIDCRIFLLSKAREIMETEGFDFVFTGEVLGQRPMSQHLRAMRQVEKESGLTGRLLRPLCAKLLKMTEPESEGLIDREKLLDIQGRSRKRQMALAEEFGIKDYATPAGGCTLTDENYARKYLDLAGHTREITCEDTVMLSMGRHLRLSDTVKIVVGRHELENDYLESEWGEKIQLTTLDHPGPVTVVIGDPTEDELLQAAAITARYSDGKREAMVRVSVADGGDVREVEVAPASDGELDRWRV
jgi:tRNA U34 2-thiouridine synthase MnmA/TrmU